MKGKNTAYVYVKINDFEYEGDGKDMAEVFSRFFGAAFPPAQPAPAETKIDKLKRVIADPSATTHEKASARRLVAKLQKSRGP